LHSDSSTGDSDHGYSESLAGEGEHWGNFIAKRLLEHNEIPGSVDFRLFFTQYSYRHEWGPPCLGPIVINFREREIRYLLAEATRVPGARVLDLGCGAGWLSLELARQGAHVTALDISQTNLALGRHMVETNPRNFPFLYQKFAGLPCRLEQFGSVEYIYADLNSVELPKGEYDAVVVWDSLHHVRDLERLLAQVRVSLKPNGLFLGVDHAFATPQTIAFNDAVVPWLKDLNQWLARTNPEWLYKGINELAAQYDWGVLNVDYDVKPVPGFESFEALVRDEMLSIIRSGHLHERLDNLDRDSRLPGESNVITAEAVSPFEDVSAERVMRTLLETFRARHFRTICPLITPEQYFTAPRSEAERIFQHYLSALLVDFNEQAIKQMRADGQWFLFDLTPEQPDPDDLEGNLSRFTSSVSAESLVYALQRSTGELAEKSEYIYTLEAQLAALRSVSTISESYTSHIEAELARKNTAISGLEDRVRALEKELVRARAPRLPWKRRSD
jgi:2-polyprenyl-3-methyl-5-hydroxy-6-metoxy-1,4-benzoquinol methylase